MPEEDKNLIIHVDGQDLHEELDKCRGLLVELDICREILEIALEIINRYVPREPDSPDSAPELLEGGDKT